MQKIRIAGPPGTGKTRYLMKRYYDALDKYLAADIMIMSHTKTAANEIREKINDPENIAKYHKETGKDLFNLIKETKKIREKNIHISLRGETIRVSPNVYNNKRDLDKFFNTISKAPQISEFFIHLTGGVLFSFHIVS